MTIAEQHAALVGMIEKKQYMHGYHPDTVVCVLMFRFGSVLHAVSGVVFKANMSMIDAAEAAYDNALTAMTTFVYGRTN